LIGIAAFYIWFAWLPVFAVLGGDDAAYLAMAAHFSPFSSLHDRAVTTEIMRASVFPPLFPAILALLGADIQHVEFAHLISTLLLIAAFIVFAAWVWAETKSSIEVLLLTALVAALPVTILQSVRILSENLYLLLSLLTFWSISRTQRSASWWDVAACAAGLAAITRSVGMALVLAFIGYVVISRNNRAWRLALIAIAPPLLWMSVKWLFGYGANYTRNFWEIARAFEGEPGREWLLEKAASQLRAIWNGWVSCFDPGPSVLTLIVASTIGVICFAGLIVRLKQRHIDAIYVLIYLLVILIWPFPEEARRFMFVVTPILLLYGFQFLKFVATRLSSELIAQSLRYAYIAVVVLIIIPPLGFIVQRTIHPDASVLRFSTHWYKHEDFSASRLLAEDELRFIASIKRVGKTVPPGECVYEIRPISLMLLANRAAYSPPASNDARHFNETADLCRFFHVAVFTGSPYVQSFYPFEYLAQYREVVDVQRGVYVPVVAMLVKKAKLTTND